MASNFPNTVDSFINPQYTKVNGVDYVKAEHINDIQDALRNVQLSIIGNGVSLNIASNNYIPVNAAVKTAIEIFDAEIKNREEEFLNHRDSVLATDAFQHHSNVVRVTPIGNLSSERLQTALEELQADIDAIMAGGYVESISLDDRYILKGGPAIVTGTMEVMQDFKANSHVTLGSTGSHTTTITGSLNVGNGAVIVGDAEIRGNLVIPTTSKIGASGNTEYTNIMFAPDKVTIKSQKDIEFVIDSDDATDGLSQVAALRVKDGSNSEIFSLTEGGYLTVSTKVLSSLLEASSHLSVGGSQKTRYEASKIVAQPASIIVQLDADSTQDNEFYAITKNGDLADNDASQSIVMKVDNSKIITGNHVLKRGVQEKGYFGLKYYSDNAGGRFYGIGVNFKSKLQATPSSVTLTIDTDASENYNNVSITDINEYGFFVECDSLRVGNVELKGTYETVGN